MAWQAFKIPSREIGFSEVDDTFAYKELQHLEALVPGPGRDGGEPLG